MKSTWLYLPTKHEKVSNFIRMAIYNYERSLIIWSSSRLIATISNCLNNQKLYFCVRRKSLIRKKRFAHNQMLHKMRNGKKHEFSYTKNVAKFEVFAGTFFWAQTSYFWRVTIHQINQFLQKKFGQSNTTFCK